MAQGSTRSLTEMSTRNLPGGKKLPPRRVGNLAAICEPMSENVGASTSRNPMGFQGLYRYNLTFYLYVILHSFTNFLYVCCQLRNTITEYK
jgi:hypothetical protein